MISDNKPRDIVIFCNQGSGHYLTTWGDLIVDFSQATLYTSQVPKPSLYKGVTLFDPLPKSPSPVVK